MEDPAWSVGRSVAVGVLTTLLVIAGVANMGRSRVAQEEENAELSRYERAVLHAEERLPVAAREELAQYFESVPAEGGSTLAAAEGHALAAKGLLRLSDEFLIVRIRLLSTALGRIEAETCAKYIVGRERPSDILRIVLALDSVELDLWVDGSLRSSLYAIREEPKRRWASDAQVQTATAVLLAGLTPDQHELLMAMSNQPSELSQDEMCRAGRLFLSRILTLPQHHAASLARMLAEPRY